MILCLYLMDIIVFPLSMYEYVIKARKIGQRQSASLSLILKTARTPPLSVAKSYNFLVAACSLFLYP